MNPNQRIPILPIDLKNQQPTEVKDCFIELFDNHLHFKMEFFASEPKDIDDPSLGWNDAVYNHFEIIALKKNISGMEKSFTADKKWGIYIIVKGFTTDIKAFFKKRGEAEDLYQKIEKWLIA